MEYLGEGLGRCLISIVLLLLVQLQCALTLTPLFSTTSGIQVCSRRLSEVCGAGSLRPFSAPYFSRDCADPKKPIKTVGTVVGAGPNSGAADEVSTADFTVRVYATSPKQILPPDRQTTGNPPRTLHRRNTGHRHCCQTRTAIMHIGVVRCFPVPGTHPFAPTAAPLWVL